MIKRIISLLVIFMFLFSNTASATEINSINSLSKMSWEIAVDYPGYKIKTVQSGGYNRYVVWIDSTNVKLRITDFAGNILTDYNHGSAFTYLGVCMDKVVISNGGNTVYTINAYSGQKQTLSCPFTPQGVTNAGLLYWNEIHKNYSKDVYDFTVKGWDLNTESWLYDKHYDYKDIPSHREHYSISVRGMYTYVHMWETYNNDSGTYHIFGPGNYDHQKDWSEGNDRESGYYTNGGLMYWYEDNDEEWTKFYLYSRSGQPSEYSSHRDERAHMTGEYWMGDPYDAMFKTNPSTGTAVRYSAPIYSDNSPRSSLVLETEDYFIFKRETDSGNFIYRVNANHSSKSLSNRWSLSFTYYDNIQAFFSPNAENGVLVVSNWSSNSSKYYLINRESGQVLNQMTIPEGVFDANYLGDDGELYKITLDSSQIIRVKVLTTEDVVKTIDGLGREETEEYTKNTGWFRIASNPGNRAFGRFIIKEEDSGSHQTVQFISSIHYGRNPVINILSNSSYSSNGSFRKVRLIYKGTYDEVYLEVYVDRNDVSKCQAFLYDNIQKDGWILQEWTTGSIPSGYTKLEVDLDKTEGGLMVGNNKVWHQGNDGSGTGLDSDMLDGKDSQYYTTAANITTDTSHRFVTDDQIDEWSSDKITPNFNSLKTVSGARATSGTSIDLILDVTDNISNDLTYSVNGGTYQALPLNKIITAPVEGTGLVTITVTVKDEAGNPSSKSISIRKL